MYYLVSLVIFCQALLLLL